MAQNVFEQAIEAILKGDADKASEIAKNGLNEGLDPLEIMEKGFIVGINQVGALFETGRLFLPALIYSATAMEKATEILNEAIPEELEPVSGKVLVATVEGDVHDIGKTIVVSLFKANGFEIMDLGRDVAIDKIIDAAEKFGADVIGTSTLLTTTMPGQKTLEQDLRSAGLREKYKTIVGGAPITQRWADRIGADAYAQDANDGVKKVRELLTPSG